MGLFTKLFGTRSDREIKKITPIVDAVEALADEYAALSDSQLRDKTRQFKERYEAGETLDDLLPEAYATVREAATRVLGMRHYRVQIIGGIILHQGRIAEMKTGEGKTLVATLPAYLNALTGRGVHVVTVNDYLARRDSEWMGKVHRFLGLSVGLIVHGLTSAQRREAYAADITYGTNVEFGFDYLRDNMAIYKAGTVQRGQVYAIVDEVDSILVDEARTPLIISGSGDESSIMYLEANAFVRRLKKKVYATTDSKEEEQEDVDADYIVDEKARSATLTARGIKKAEEHFKLENLTDLSNVTLSHHINQAIKAWGVMKKDVDYIIKDGEIVIVDEFTGRMMPGRRYSEGLHQAIEAKEGVQVRKENRTLATITYQNFFRLYEKLAGMTGTALTEEEEFDQIYHLDVVEIPTNRPNIRIDRPDAVYKNDNGKNNAIIQQIEACHAKGQPILVGTVSIEKSEQISKLLSRRGIAHNVLNAKQHEREAEIVAQAGKLGAVTISTNMAGRGTDIMLGGNAEFLALRDVRRSDLPEHAIAEANGHADSDDPDVLEARRLFNEAYSKYKKDIDVEAQKVRETGGLFILGTERHESRRIDNQLRGRAARQGDPGETLFVVSLTDDLMRLFGGERIQRMMDSLGLEEDMPIDQKIVSSAIENAQKNVESRHFQARKTVLEYDDVMNRQRTIIYDQRRRVLDGEDIKGNIMQMLHELIVQSVHGACGDGKKPLDKQQLKDALRPFEGLFLTRASADDPRLLELDAEGLIEELERRATAIYDQREKLMGESAPGQPLMRELERVILLRVVDEYWMDHIDAMSDLRQGIGLQAYAQNNPVEAYKREGMDMFDDMISGIKDQVVKRIFTVRIQKEQKIERKSVTGEAVPGANAGGGARRAPVKKSAKPGRNDPCPCGSGLKYKKCHGRYEN